MDNDDAIVGTILSRRQALRLAATGGVGLAFGGLFWRSATARTQAQVQREVKLVASPAVTEGPFYVDEKLNRSNLVGGSTRPTVAGGIPLTLTFTVYRLVNGKFQPLPGATVDVWHADAIGVYSDEAVEMNHENTAGQNWLRGYQVTDANGVVRFETIFPGWYESRTAHIHFKVRQKDGATTKEFTSQLFFDDALADKLFRTSPYRRRGENQVRNGTDMVFTERQVDGTVAGEHLTIDLKPEKDGYSAAFAVALTDDNLRSGRRGFGGPGGPPTGGPGGPGGPPPDWDES